MENIEISDELWTRISSVLPKYIRRVNGGRPRLELKKVFKGIIYIKINKLPWKAVPEIFGSKTAINDYYRHWAKCGAFHSLKDSGIFNHPELINVDFDWDKIESLFASSNISTRLH